jgi:hypothetical protein
MRTTILHEPSCEGRDYVYLDGSFAPNGSSALVATSNRGKGFTVARTTNGVFTITLDNDYLALVAATATIQMSTPTDIVPQFGAYTGGTSSAQATLVLNTLVAATATDIAANASNRVSFRLVFRKGSVTP